jgi:hypothetical protein
MIGRGRHEYDLRSQNHLQKAFFSIEESNLLVGDFSRVKWVMIRAVALVKEEIIHFPFSLLQWDKQPETNDFF